MLLCIIYQAVKCHVLLFVVEFILAFPNRVSYLKAYLCLLSSWPRRISVRVLYDRVLVDPPF